MSAHLAAQITAPGTPLTITTLSTPTPSPTEVLIKVHSVALNPADTIMLDHGIFISSFPNVLGFDISGTIAEVGAQVPASAGLHVGTRVAAYAAFFWERPQERYGAFQEKVLVPWEFVVSLPETMGFNEAATVPVGFQVSLCAWDALGFDRVKLAGTGSGAEEGVEGEKKEALLVWGASSSVGTGGVQSASVLRDDASSSIAKVYATAGSANLEYVAGTGADRVFDYAASDAVESIVRAAKEDGLVIRNVFLAKGDIAVCQQILEAFVDKGNTITSAKIASAPPLPADVQSVAGIETIFLQPSIDEEERRAQFQYWLGTWLKEHLAAGRVKPSPEPKVVGKGLETINEGLDILRKGVSCSKLVVEIKE